MLRYQRAKVCILSNLKLISVSFFVSKSKGERSRLNSSRTVSSQVSLSTFHTVTAMANVSKYLATSSEILQVTPSSSQSFANEIYLGLLSVISSSAPVAGLPPFAGGGFPPLAAFGSATSAAYSTGSSPSIQMRVQSLSIPQSISQRSIAQGASSVAGGPICIQLNLTFR